MALFHNWESFNCNDAELGATLPHLCCFSILRRVEPAPCRLHAGELKNGHAARGVSVAFKQSISLAACQITRAIFWQNLKCQSAVLLLERLRSGGRGPFHNNESRTFFLLSDRRRQNNRRQDNRTEKSNDTGMRSEERRVGKECRSRWSPY